MNIDVNTQCVDGFHVIDVGIIRCKGQS